ncbi:aspartic peptidase domain-containing protein [Mycena vulgaris]|nr:aspartic peptidase domain-containing protein [Mycena vulgaris]
MCMFSAQNTNGIFILAVIVMIDIGSTDMYVAGGVSAFNDTGAVVALGYTDGSQVNGTIGLASLDFSGYKIPAQAFINVTNGDTGYWPGLIGLGFDSPSHPIPSAITAAGLNGTLIGKSVLSNIFDQNPDKRRIFALSLSRNDDQGGTADGSLDIDEYDDLYPEVEWSGGWSILMDGMFFNDIRDAIYSAVPGAVHTGPNSTFNENVWVIPCDAAIDLHTMFGGQNSSLHPLELSDVHVFSGPDGQSYTVCTRAIANDRAMGWGRDTLFGRTFLRNVYAVFGFGNETTGPYAQMLSQTNFTVAAADFSAIRSQLLTNGPPELFPADLVQRLDGPSSTSIASSSTSTASSPASCAPTGDLGGQSIRQLDLAANAPSTASTSDSKLSKYGPIVIGANLALLLLLMCLAVSRLVITGRRSGPQGARDAKYTPVKLREDMP